jgi:FkbM family methyltransferase
LKSAVPDLHAILFEPFLPNVEFIRATAQHAVLDGIEVIVAAVSDQTGQGTLKTNPLSGATSSLEVNDETFEEMHWGTASGWQETLLTSIDETRSRHEPVDFIKIDVEGHEGAVLRGAAQTIASDQPILFIECCHPGKPCLVPLQQQGYRVVDADRLTLDPHPDSTNFFAFPQRFSSSVDLILSNAITFEKPRNSRHGNFR